MKSIHNISNIWAYILKESGVFHTTTFIDNLYNTRYDRLNLYGTSKMLETYNIDHIITSIDNEDLENIEPLFVTNLNQQLVVVKDINKENSMVTYVDNSITEQCISIDNFLKNWNNIVILMGFDKEKNIEPDYSNNKLDQWKRIIKYSLYILFIILLVYTNFSQEFLYFRVISLLINSIGLYLSSLLFLKDLKIKSSTTDKICSFFKNSKCNKDLNQRIPFVNLSIAGLSYFLFNIVIILFFVEQLELYILINAISLLFTVWSIWYQMYKVKQWCVLCLLVQVVLWGIFLINVFYFGKYFADIINQFTSLLNLTRIQLFTLLPIFYTLFNSLFFYKKLNIDYEKSNRYLDYFKSNKIVVDSIFRHQKKYNLTQSSIMVGNIESEVKITMLLSLNCPLCENVSNIIYKNRELSVSVSYIFYDSINLDIISIFINYARQNNSSSKIVELIHEWYTSGIVDKNLFITKYEKYCFDDSYIQEEIARYKVWIKQNHLTGTPISFVNNTIIPSPFNLTDILIYHDLYTNIH